MKTKFTLVMACLTSCILTGCIENDVDYPYVSGNIEQIEVEGMISSPTINKNAKTIDISISDEYDIEKLTITRLTVENDASIFPDKTKCIDPNAFPEKGFSSLDSLDTSTNTKINFSTPVEFLIQTYQDYNWTITVNQEWESIISFDNLTDAGYFFDYENKQLLVYMDEGTDLTNMVISELQFKSSVERLNPEPYTITDFSRSVEFEVTYFDRVETWKVIVVYGTNIEPSANAYPLTKQAVVTGNCRSNSTIVIEYRRRGANDWITLDEDQIEYSGTTYTTIIRDLIPRATYNCRVTINGEEYTVDNFTTASLEELVDGSFDNWYNNGRYWCPWEENGVEYWDSGNRGVTVVGGTSNTIPTLNTVTGRGYAAELKSVYAAGMKFAAGNIFVGYFDDLDGTNGILSFGRQFYSYPTKIRFDYKYTSEIIDRCNDDTRSSMYSTVSKMIGQPDSCHVYWALTDWDEPLTIRTRYDVRQLVDVNDPNIIAYGEFVTSNTTNEYQSIEREFVYRNYRTPRYLMIVATSSKWGDYFTGGEGSTLWLDEMELLYD